jgi:hypothetical protein
VKHKNKKQKPEIMTAISPSKFSLELSLTKELEGSQNRDKKRGILLVAIRVCGRSDKKIGAGESPALHHQTIKQFDHLTNERATDLQRVGNPATAINCWRFPELRRISHIK